MSTRETRTAILRLMRYAAAALDARYRGDLVVCADMRTSADDCRIAIRATTGGTS